MAEEIKTPEDNKDVDYIEAIKKLKDTTVPKEEFEKIQNEKKELLQALVDGDQMEKAIEPPKVDVDALRKDVLNNDNLSNLEYVSKALELREALIDQGEPDPFLPWGEKIAPTVDDVEAANRVAEALKSCVDYADGDSSIFTNELQRITIDNVPVRGRR